MKEKAACDIQEISSDGKLSNFLAGVKSGVPIAVGYIPIAVTFGLVSKNSGIPNLISILMSFLIFAGASQFIGVNLIASGASVIEIVMTTFILNFRHFLMSSSLSQRIPGDTSKKMLSILSFGITDETFALASLRKEEKINSWLLLGLNTIAFSSWNFGTWIGVFLGDALPKSLSTSMNIALYAMFIGLVVPSVRASKSILIVVIIAVTINCILYWVPSFSFISMGWSIIISTIISAAAGAVLFKGEGE